MKTFLPSGLGWTIALMLIFGACSKPVIKGPDPLLFQNPPANSKLHVWWHWLDGAITREGITKDLESMQQQGVCQATILNVGLFDGKDFGVPRVIFNSPEWHEMFKWALQEASRLGIRIGVHNCDGWSSTGGPWITPEMSMKQLTWTKTVLSSRDSGPFLLRRPLANHDFYRDVAVIAVRSKEGRSSLQQSAPQIFLNDTVPAGQLADGSPTTSIRIREGDQLVYRFSRPFKAGKICLLPARSFMWGNPDDFISGFSLSVSKDGKNFEKIADISLRGLNALAEFPVKPVDATIFRLTVTDLSDIDAWIPVDLSEAEILSEEEKPLYNPVIPHLLEKSGAIKPAAESFFYTSAEGSGFPGEKEVQLLTEGMDADGKLNWKVPDGNWSVYRIGYTTTGATNAPATREGLGLECDKMDTVALNLHFSNFPSKLITTAGAHTGNTFGFMLIDSWECGFQNWTAGMLKEFEKRRGYDLLTYLPVLCGEVIGSPELSEAILYDFRKTIAELIQANYYEHYRDLLHANKLELHAEVIYGNANYPPLDILKTTACVDLPMFEFWTGANPNTSLLEYRPAAQPELHLPASAAICYNKPVMASEAYTGMAHYSESPAALKQYGDRAYCSGINQMILHSYVHQPNDIKPGMTLGQFASHFNRNNMYWQYLSGWSDYQGRIQYMLQQGTADPDILYYLGDQLPQYYENNPSTSVPFGYNVSACNFDILKHKIKVKDGKLILSDNISFSLLSLPQRAGMNYQTLCRIAELVKDGALVYGPKPDRMFSRHDLETYKDEFQRLADEVWGNTEGKLAGRHNYGRGMVCWGPDLAGALKEMKVNPDIEDRSPDSAVFLFIHKKIGDKNAYYVVNQTNEMQNREFTFAVGEKTPEIWRPEDGSVFKPAVFNYTANGVILPLYFKPREAMIILFSNHKSTDYIAEVSRDDKILFPDPGGDMSFLPQVEFADGKWMAASTVAGNYRFTTGRGKAFSLTLGSPVIIDPDLKGGKLKFESYYTGIPEEQDLTELKPLDQYDDPRVRYFSGKAIYTVRLAIADSFLLDGSELYLDLGHFDATAEIVLNGEILGHPWLPGALWKVTGKLKPENELQVSVATTWRNRFIGDFAQHGKMTNIWTSAPVESFLDKDKPLKPSGWIGPVRIVKVVKKELK